MVFLRFFCGFFAVFLRFFCGFFAVFLRFFCGFFVVFVVFLRFLFAITSYEDEKVNVIFNHKICAESKIFLFF